MKTKKILILAGIIVFLGLAAAVSFGTYQLFAVELASKPSVQFLQPLHEQSVPLNGSLVRFIARDKEGIEHVELWVDGELYASKKSELPQGSTPFPLVELWQPDSEGQHVLTARAYNSKNRDATASVVVQVSEETIVKELPADLPPGNAGAEAPAPGDGAPPAAEEEEAKEFISLLDDSIEIEPLEGFLSEPDTPILDMIPKIRLPGDAVLKYARLLAVEALYLETDRAYDGVFCYLSLADSEKELIPDPEEADFIEADEGNFWDIKSLLSGYNKRVVYLDEDAAELNVYLECWGAIFEEGVGDVFDLGTMNASHDSSDWDGHTIEETIPGPDGWFRVGYRINPVEGTDDGLPAPHLFYSCYEPYMSDNCTLIWDYPDEAREIIDGFIIMMNDNFLIHQSGRYRDGIHLNRISGSLPTCCQTYQYQVLAYIDDPILGEKSLPSNPVSVTAPPCYEWVEVHFEYINPGCLSGDASINFCGSREVYGDTELNLDSDAEWERDEGCSYANLWANEHNIDVGKSDRRDCFHWTGGALYRVIDQSGCDTDTAYVALDERETLTIGMNVYDWDVFNDDLQCYGEYVYYPGEIEEIAKLPGSSKTYTRYFCQRGGGGCIMQYTIKVRIITPPSDE